MLTFPRPLASAHEDESDSLGLLGLDHPSQTSPARELPARELPAREWLDRDPLLVTKLQLPPAPHDLIPRPQLTSALGPAAGQHLTVLCAPTGFGKTTALREWVASTDRPVAWLSLDSRDNDSARFWTYVIAAIEKQQPGFGAHAVSLLHLPEPTMLEYVITSIINELASQPIDLSIVLDDYHVITDDAIHRSMRFLLEHLPPHLHLLVAGRSDPPLSLPRLRAQGLLIELRGPELRFRPDEASAFLIDAMGLELSSHDVAQLELRTEGWVAGLRLAGVALRQHDDPAAFISGFSGQHRSIGDYLAGDVLDQQSDDLQQFMLETSILDRLSGSLCDAVTGRTDGQAVLEALESANAFLIPLDEQRHWYRYQGLFADVLRDRLARDDTQRTISVHRRAARWYLDNRMTREAVAHALAGGDLELVAEIVEQRSCPMLASGELDTISKWIAPLPRGMVETRPILGCLLAWVMVLTGRVDEADPLLDAVERATIASGATGSLGEIAAIRAYAARLRHQIPLAIELSRKARELTPADSYSLRRAIALNYGIALWWCWEADEAERAFQEAVELAEIGGEHAAAVVALCHRAKIRLDQGFIDQSWALFQEAIALADRLGVSSLPSQSFVFLGMAYLLIERDELDEAEQCLQQCIELGLAGGKIDHVILAHVELTRIQLARGDIGAARIAARNAQTALDRHPVLHVTQEVDLSRVMLWIAEGNLSAADRWADETLARVEHAHEALSEPEQMALVHLRLAQQRPDAARESLRSLHERSAATLSNDWCTCRIYSLILMARTLELEGSTDAAIQTITDALRMAEPLGHIRTFADHGARLVTLLSQVKPASGVSRAYLERISAACGPLPVTESVHRPASDTSTPLSQRELEVLRHIQDGLSNREIAEALYVTVGTVKRHTNSIYSKLAVGSRTQALARARTLNIFGA